MSLKKMADLNNDTCCRIICIGNRLIAPDSAGPLVHDILLTHELPDSIELIDGGLGGLNLLCFFENTKKILFVDNVEGFLEKPGITTITLPSQYITTGEYGHDAGLGYLMKMAPGVIDSKMPECILVGIEGDLDHVSLKKAAVHCLELAGFTGHTSSPGCTSRICTHLYE